MHVANTHKKRYSNIKLAIIAEQSPIHTTKSTTGSQEELSVMQLNTLAAAIVLGVLSGVLLILVLIITCSCMCLALKKKKTVYHEPPVQPTAYTRLD